MTLPVLARNGAMTFVKPGVCFVGVRSRVLVESLEFRGPVLVF